MSIVKAYTLPHPPLAVPSIGRGQEKEIPKTIAAYEEVAADIACVAPETIIYVTPHSVLYADHIHISPGSFAYGDFARFGASDVRLETEYDEELAEKIESIANSSDISAGGQGQRDAKLDHGVLVPMWYINKHYKNYKSLRISQSGMSPPEHYMFGQIIAKAAEMTTRKVVVIASSDLSHRLKDSGNYGFAPEGPIFDAAITEVLDTGDFLSLLKISKQTRERAGECGYNSLTTLAGCLDRQSVKAKLYAYEGTFGVGYAIASFEPTGIDENRNILEKYIELTLEESNAKRKSEDDYQKIARQSLEHIIRTKEMLSIPNDLPSELLNERAGVFVSLHKNGRLRGCIGTIVPSTKCIAEEIIQNAVSAGLSDSRFPPVAEEELDYLTYKVDLLSAAERINSSAELDVKRYGVIVTSGMKRGLLLPNLDGVDTVEEQIAIARSKAGISEGEKIELERFEVIRHE